MTKNIESKNTSTELFYDLQSVLLKRAGKQCRICVVIAFRILSMMLIFMSAFIRLTINHICHNFEKFTTQEGNQGHLTEVNFEEVAERLVRNAWVFC